MWNSRSQLQRTRGYLNATITVPPETLRDSVSLFQPAPAQQSEATQRIDLESEGYKWPG
jgi:hypothetical protein